MDTNFYQVKELSDEEKKKMYMTMDKEAIVNMLIESNKVIDKLSKVVIPSSSANYIFVTFPRYDSSN